MTADGTLNYYERQAEALARRYESADMTAFHRLLDRWLPEEGDILEIGCGSGRDARYLSGKPSRRITATDASENMLRQARERAPETDGGRLVFSSARFPLSEGHHLLKRRFSGILAAAVIMHIPDEELFDLAWQIRELLLPGGIFICSFSRGDRGEDGGDRVYYDREAGEIQLLFERLGFSLLHGEDSGDRLGLGRSLTWTTQVYRLDTETASRSLDNIESIINRDAKTATYKLALLRALCDISQTGQKHVQWHAGNTVSVPLGLIVGKWIEYYWPIFASELYLPEMIINSRVRGLAFRTKMEDFMAIFGGGGLSAFTALFESGRLSRQQGQLLGRLSSLIAQTIVKGPVTYAGGSLNSSEKVFSFKGSKSISHCQDPVELIRGFGRVSFSGGLWRELTLIGHWIGESLIIRWAELSHNFAGEQIDLSDILKLLLTVPESARKVDEAKKIYRELNDLHCTWSRESIIGRPYDIDHVIPFSLWHNNDLWNLLPALKKVNSSKRDKLVTRQTLLDSRDLIIHYWAILRERLPERFDNELSTTLLGRPADTRNWENSAYSALMENVESLALQRGVERWGLYI